MKLKLTGRKKNKKVDKFLEKNKLFSKKISESKKKIKEEKEKIRIEKKKLKNNKRDKFYSSKMGKFVKRIISFFRLDRDHYSFSEVFIITVVSLLIGAFACFSVFVVITGGRNYFVLSKDLDKLVEVYETISKNYYDDVDKKNLVDEAIDAMVSSVGDAYTSYVDSDSALEFNELVNGQYEGIGCTIQLTEKGIMVLEVFDGGPADKAGVKGGDLIISVDGKKASDMSANDMANYIKNESGSNIKMIVLREDEEKEIKLTRGIVETPVVNSTIYEKNEKKIGYLSISIFSAVSSKQFNNKLEMLEKQNIDSLIIDVRDNNGGYLTEVTSIASMLLPKGKTIYQIQRDDKKESTKDKTLASKDYPIAILVNGGSASASEILAAAIKESYGGFVVGTKTYGKGTVQQTKKLSDGSMIKYTIENWLSPDGNWIDEAGIEPTHEVALTDEYYNNPVVENDSQLQKALELVSE